MTNNSHAFFIPAECNLPQFTSYVIRNECERNTTKPISISAYQGGLLQKISSKRKLSLSAVVMRSNNDERVQMETLCA